MRSQAELQDILYQIDGRPYPQYKRTRGKWVFDTYELIVDRVQGDPFAAPSRVRIRSNIELPSLPNKRGAKVASEDWLLRKFRAGLHSSRRGSGRSGTLQMLAPGAEIVERTAVRIVGPALVEFRFRIGLPARGRRILGREAWQMLSSDLANAVEHVRNTDGLAGHVQSVLRQRSLRSQLNERGLVAFVENGSILPRRSGVDERPMQGAVPFRTPESLSVALSFGDEIVTGMGIPEGVTVIVGGGFHGKSTLLQAIQTGHVDHIPGDGREGVVARRRSVKVRAEDGRCVTNVNISWFLKGLPGGRGTQAFQTSDASGSTSQAASIVESIEAGADLMLVDEDTSATNLLVRDERMWQLIGREHEPITPFVERVGPLQKEFGMSTILVIGGVADYLAVADTVIGMVDFSACDLTEQAASLAIVAPVSNGPIDALGPRALEIERLNPGKIRVRDENRIQYGRGELRLDAVEQISSYDQAWSIAQAMRWIFQNAGQGWTVRSAIDALDVHIDNEGLECLCPWDAPCGDIVRPRPQDVAAAINRLRLDRDVDSVTN